MKCSNCGHQLSDPQQFCPECGNQIKIEQKERKGKKLFFLLSGFFGVVLLFIVAFVVLYNVGKSKFTPDQLIENLEAAVESEDPKTLANMLHPNGDHFTISEREANDFIRFLNENPDEFSALKTKLHEQIEELQEFNVDVPMRDQVYGEVFVRKSGKKWGVFDNYELAVIPAYIHLTIKSGELDIYIDDEKVATLNDEQQNETFGPYMPGTYNVKAVFENAYAKSEEETNISLSESGLKEVPYTFEMEIEEISITSAFQDYDLYINGERTDIPISKTSNQPIGDFPTNGTVALQLGKDFPWGHAKTNEEIIDSQYNAFELIHPLTHDEQIKLMEALNDIIHSYLAALEKQDVSLLSERTSDHFTELLEKAIVRVHRGGAKYKGEMRHVTYDAEKITNPVYDDNLEAYTMKILTEYIFYEPHKSINWLNLGSGDLEDENKYAQELTIYYDESIEDWVLHDTKTSYLLIGDHNAEKFEFND